MQTIVISVKASIKNVLIVCKHDESPNYTVQFLYDPFLSQIMKHIPLLNLSIIKFKKKVPIIRGEVFKTSLNNA